METTIPDEPQERSREENLLPSLVFGYCFVARNWGVDRACRVFFFAFSSAKSDIKKHRTKEQANK